MTAERPVLSLIVPVYNSARFIEPNLQKAIAFLERFPAGSELILVDDCSADATPAILERFRAAHPERRIRVLQNEPNQGKGYSVRRAMLEATGEVRVFTDADLTYPIENVENVLARLAEGCDVAVACRVHPDSRYIVPANFLPMLLTRHLMGRTFSLLARVLLVGSLRDTQAGLKGFTAAAAERVFPLQTMNRFAFDLEILTIARHLGLAVGEVGVEFHYTKEPSTIRFFGDSLKMARDMWRIRMNLARGRYGEPRPAEEAVAP